MWKNVSLWFGQSSLPSGTIFPVQIFYEKKALELYSMYERPLTESLWLKEPLKGLLWLAYLQLVFSSLLGIENLLDIKGFYRKIKFSWHPLRRRDPLLASYARNRKFFCTTYVEKFNFSWLGSTIFLYVPARKPCYRLSTHKISHKSLYFHFQFAWKFCY